MPSTSASASIAGAPEAVFPTRVDAWLVVLLGASLVFSAGAVWFGAREEPGDAAVAAVILTASFLAVGLVSIPTRYHVTSDELVIRSGLVRYRVPLRAIQRVHPTRDMTAGPAWSLDRLGIDYRRDGRRARALISPARREEFLELLRERGGLVRQGEELRREA